MRVAILGGGLVAIHTAAYLKQRGMGPELFCPPPLGELFCDLAQRMPEAELPFPWHELSHPDFLAELGLHKRGEVFPQAQEYWQEYLLPLLENFDLPKDRRPESVIQIGKRFPTVVESLPFEKRLDDLFRLQLVKRADGALEQQLEEQPQLWEALGSEVVASLKEDFTLQEYFQWVVVTPEIYQAENDLCWGGLGALGDFRAQALGREHISLSGRGKSLLWAVFALSPDVWEERIKTLLLITPEELFQGVNASFKEQWLQQVKEGARICRMDYEGKVAEWKGLPLQEQARRGAPQMPEFPFQKFEFRQIEQVDRLLDRKGLFLTLEKIHSPTELPTEQSHVVRATDCLLELDRVSFKWSPEIMGFHEPGISRVYEISHLPLVEADILRYFRRR